MTRMLPLKWLFVSQLSTSVAGPAYVGCLCGHLVALVLEFQKASMLFLLWTGQPAEPADQGPSTPAGGAEHLT